MIDDTIAAISTPIGDAGIGIIRLSGPLAIQVVFEIFKPKRDLNKIKSHKLIYGHIINPLTGDFVDEVLLSIMKGPKSYTREDVVEINSHSGIVVLRKILDIVLIYGVRIAQPGEFTKRAFLNGRIDLAQAEAVMDIIRARTDASLKIACEQMEGKLSKKIKDIYNRLVDLLAYIEADIDYPEDDVSPVNFLFIEEKINEIISEIEGLLANAEYGKIFREGIKVAIVGRTNVGKSSLLNALLKENRAIVTEIPGTTRDSIEEYLNLSGIPVQIIDTAGIRETIDTIEKIGVQKTREIIEKSDLILYVMDVSEDFTSKDMEILNSITSKKFILIMNKIDLPRKLKLPEHLLFNNIVEISLLDDNVDKVEKAILSLIYTGNISDKEGIFVSNLRHKKALNDSYLSLKEVKKAINNRISSDIIAIDLKNSINYLGEITGYTVTEDVLNRIFENFCVGK